MRVQANKDVRLLELVQSNNTVKRSGQTVKAGEILVLGDPERRTQGRNHVEVRKVLNLEGSNFVIITELGLR